MAKILGMSIIASWLGQRHWQVRGVLVILAWGLASVGQAGKVSRYKGVDGFNPTFFFDLNFGFTTYHSELAAMNDRNTHVGYTFGGTAGAEYEYSFFVRTDTNTTSFLLNDYSITTQWRDSVFRYRLWFFYLGLALSQVEVTAAASGTPVVDGFGQGFGGNFGMHLPVGRSGVLYVDVLSASMSTTKDTLSETTAFGARTDVDIGGAMELTKQALDFIIGYRQRTFGLQTDSTYIETLYTTYVGLRLAAFF